MSRKGKRGITTVEKGAVVVKNAIPAIAKNRSSRILFKKRNKWPQ